MACEIREESQQSNYINDNVVCFTMNDVDCDAYNAIGFPFDVVSIYTDSEEIPVTRCYMHSVQCREDCGADFCLKVIKTMNKTYKCDISVSDTDFLRIFHVRYSSYIEYNLFRYL